MILLSSSLERQMHKARRANRRARCVPDRTVNRGDLRLTTDTGGTAFGVRGADLAAAAVYPGTGGALCVPESAKCRIGDPSGCAAEAAVACRAGARCGASKP